MLDTLIESNELEIWMNIPGFEGYYMASNFGRIKSVSRFIPTRWDTPKWQDGVILKLSSDQDGYNICSVSNATLRNITRKVHRLVAMAFIENPENKPMVNHKDANKQNNHVDNLEWVTNQENMTHGVKNDLFFHPKGELAGNSKLTTEQILEIRAIGKSKKLTEIAEMFNISFQHVSDILLRGCWKHV